MSNSLNQNINLEELLKPENPVERMLIGHAGFKEGLLWGRPRFGHPEGKVVFHINEVLANIDKLQLSCTEKRSKLRVIAYLHDTFKHKEDKNRSPRNWDLHHGAIARRFATEYIQDLDVLKIIQWHDEAYYIWRLENIYKDLEASQQRMEKFMEIMAPDFPLYYLFFVCDTRTGDKNQAPLKWFERNFSSIQPVKI